MPDVEKEYDAIYVGRRITLKRQMLARKVNRFAIVAASNHFVANPRDPYVIQQTNLEQAQYFRQTFIKMLQEVLIVTA